MRTSVRWFVPAAVAATVASGVAVSSARADTAPNLPSRTPEQVLAAVAGQQVTALSGTVVTRTDLGLPTLDLSGVSGGHGGLSATDVQGLATRFLTGGNTLRVWVDGQTRQRVQLIDPLDEFDLVRNGNHVWTYSARHNEVGKGTLPEGDHSGGPATGATPKPSDLTPEAMAKQALAAADPTTSVTLGTPETVAGRSAYALTLTPRTTQTLVDRIVIAVDSEKSVPLQVEVFARGYAKPAIQTGFTSVDFSRPAADRFTFTPPKGAKVTEFGKAESAPSQRPGSPQTSPPSSAHPQPTVTGAGWAAVVEFPAETSRMAPGTHPTPSVSAGSPTSPETAGAAAGLLDQVTRPVAGGRAVTTRLMSVLITDDGRVLAGAVPVQTLVDAARR